MPTDRQFYFRADSVPEDARVIEADVCVYGGCAGGVAAAVQAARLGYRTVLLEQNDEVGGMTTHGLGWTDFGRKEAVGGLALQMYREIGAHYGQETQWTFEPHVAQGVLDGWLVDAGVEVLRRRYLGSVVMEGDRIREIGLLGGLRVRAKMFVDASYEGDLLAGAGVRFTVGREANAVYGEQYNGVQARDKHQFDLPVDPYRRAGAPGSGLLPGIDASPLPPQGSGDTRMQAYNFRLCMTDQADLRLEFEKPAGYDELDHELLLRYVEAGGRDFFSKFDRVVPHKTDTNNHGPVSSDYIGMNHAWPTAGYEQREQIFQEHVRYHKGWLWTLARHPRVPADVREKMSVWGLPKDEFEHSGHWPQQLYVREGRRMVSELVMTEHHVFGREMVPDSVGLASYGMDSHNCRRYVAAGADGRAVVRNEGDLQIYARYFDPYPVGYRSMVPRRGEASNLLVAVAVSSSHITFGSIRMEPVFMVLGQSAAFAAHLAMSEGGSVQDVSYGALRPLLEQAGQVLSWTGPRVKDRPDYQPPAA